MPAFTQFVRFFSLLPLLLLSNISVAQESTPSPQKESAKILTLYNWSEYFDEKIITSFEAKYNVSIHQVFYETDELKDEYLISTNGGEGLDIIIGSDVSFKTYIKRNWLASIDNKKIPNLKNIDTRWRDTSPTLIPYSVPYLWGTVGIAYRKDKVLSPVSSWLDLFRPTAELKNKIIMIDDSRDTLGLALKALGYSTNSTTPFELGSAEKLLRNQRPFVSKYSYINLSEKSSLVTGDTWMTMVYNGDGLSLKDINPNIEFIVPKEGTNLWVDHIAILEKSKNKKLAYTFINYINTPKNAAQLASALNFASPNSSATPHLEKSFLNNTAIYPEITILDKSEAFAEFTPRKQKKRNEVYMRVIE
ncbi:hypothetical protein A9Q81_06080 [Gammaproteobacteria bacterium 42_54_T18]|nr:hypothetical protein A9Q81_06080 [Gammaproteobacteria bacterium 42_54_T18]